MADNNSINPPIDGEILLALNEESDTQSSGGRYEIRVQGHLDAHWSAWLGGLAITYEGGGTTQLTGDIPDQAALHGLLVKIRDLSLPLISLRRIAR